MVASFVYLDIFVDKIAITSSSILAGCSPSSQQAITSSISEAQDKSLEEMVAYISPLGLTAAQLYQN